MFAGGSVSNNTIEYLTISTTGNSLDFGDLLFAKELPGGLSNAVRGIWGGGEGISTDIQFVTIATTGNAQDFGDLTVSRRQTLGCSSPTRGIWGAGQNPAIAPTVFNVIDYVTIMSTGNAIDFGDLTVSRTIASAVSNGHGGL